MSFVSDRKLTTSVLTCASLRARSLSSMVAIEPFSFTPAFFSYTGTKSIAQIGHLPGLSIFTDGCMPHVQYRILFSADSPACAVETRGNIVDRDDLPCVPVLLPVKRVNRTATVDTT